MGILECDKVFELVVPDGWTVTGIPGHSYDLAAPAGMDLAVTISVYERSAARYRDRSAESLVRDLAESAGAEDADSLRVIAPAQKGQERAFVHFAADGHRVFAAFLLFGDYAVLATAISGGSETDWAEGERLVASIAPLTKKRGFFKR
jgi:hypothetical protein